MTTNESPAALAGADQAKTKVEQETDSVWPSTEQAPSGDRRPTQRNGVPDARLRRLATQVHALGERPLFELLRELIAGCDPVERIERSAALRAAFIAGLNGDKLAPPVRVATGRHP